MPLDAISETRLSFGHPVLSVRIHRLANMVELPFRVTRVFATWNEQGTLYAQGRKSLDTVNALRLSVGWAPITDAENQRVVTNAAPGDSMHNFALAADVVPDDPSIPGFQPDWNVQHPYWQQLLAAATTCGLAEGAKWTGRLRDYPHLYPVELSPEPTDEMKQTFQQAGLQGVWAELAPLFVNSAT